MKAFRTNQHTNIKTAKRVLFCAFTFLSLHCFGQSFEKKNNISLGTGRQSYNGDLGNSWFQPSEEYYGIGSLTYSRYLTKSFDALLFVTHGDYGHCREEDESQFRPDGTEVLNMLSRLTSSSISVKYKFANGYLLKEEAKLAPYIYLGAGVNNISNFWWKDKKRVNPGNCFSLNGGAGVSYNLNKKINLTYNLGFGYLASDKIDFRSEGTNDMYMQHSLLLGLNF